MWELHGLALGDVDIGHLIQVELAAIELLRHVVKTRGYKIRCHSTKAPHLKGLLSGTLTTLQMLHLMLCDMYSVGAHELLQAYNLRVNWLTSNVSKFDTSWIFPLIQKMQLIFFFRRP